MQNYYAFRVAIGDEERVKNKFDTEINKKNGICFLPMIELSLKRQGTRLIKLVPMIPGYVFVESDDIEIVCKIAEREFRNCICLRDFEGEIQPIEQREIDFLMKFADEDFQVEMSHGIKESGRVTVTKGPLVGYERLIKKIDRHRRIAIIEVELLGEIRNVTVGLEVISGDG